jgi:hypothetical protein
MRHSRIIGDVCKACSTSWKNSFPRFLDFRWLNLIKKFPSTITIVKSSRERYTHIRLIINKIIGLVIYEFEHPLRYLHFELHKVFQVFRIH